MVFSVVVNLHFPNATNSSALRLVFASEGVRVGVVMRSVELNDLVKTAF